MGGKSRIAREVWRRFGDTPNLVEPFDLSPHCGRINPVTQSGTGRFLLSSADGTIAYCYWVKHPVLLDSRPADCVTTSASNTGCFVFTDKGRKWHIYGLVDPRTDEVRYVGWAYNVQKRFREHLTGAKRKINSHKDAWITQLEYADLIPSCKVFEVGYGDGWGAAEKKWISHFRNKGNKLTNLTEGGEGVVGYVFTDAARQKMSAAKKGKPPHPNAIEAARRPKGKRPPEVGAKISARKKGSHHTEETKEKLRRIVTGFRHTEEARAKISEAGRGRIFTSETKEKISQKHRGKVLSVEHRRKLSDAKRGRVLSEEHKQHIRESSTGRPQKCGICGMVGHKRSTCPMRDVG